MVVQTHNSSALEGLAEQFQFPNQHGLHKERQGKDKGRAGKEEPSPTEKSSGRDL